MKRLEYHVAVEIPEANKKFGGGCYVFGLDALTKLDGNQRFSVQIEGSIMSKDLQLMKK
jgi:hypothetical protein